MWARAGTGEAGGDSVSAPRKRAVPRGLGARGKRLWREVAELRPTLTGPEAVMLEEACHMADRLERLTAALDGDDFLTTTLGEVDDPEVRELRLIVDKALGESRLLALSLRQVLGALELLPSGSSSGSTGPGTSSGGDPLDEFTARAASRRAAASAG